jgi:hypothetical protein
VKFSGQTIDDKILLDRIETRSNWIYIIILMISAVFIFGEADIEITVAIAKIKIDTQICALVASIILILLSVQIVVLAQYRRRAETFNYAKNILEGMVTDHNIDLAHAKILFDSAQGFLENWGKFVECLIFFPAAFLGGTLGVVYLIYSMLR